MKKELKIAALFAVAFVLGLNINNITMSETAKSCNIAVIDVQAVVANSAQVKKLQTEQQKKASELREYVNKAKQSIDKQSNAEKKKALEAKYTKELKIKTAAIDKEYAQKLKAIDKSISQTIASEAKEKNYNIVLAKGIVLYGGEDITEAVTKKVK